nr:hypothetical protein [Streptomyces sp. FXJ1.172]WEO93122.1 hypothetical protein A6P39_003020 [Streptomyces sp. FXJ1.172]
MRRSATGSPSARAGTSRPGASWIVAGRLGLGGGSELSALDLDWQGEAVAAGAINLEIALTNFFNRINRTIKEPAGKTWG